MGHENRTFHDLREANGARQMLWDPEDKVSVFWRVNELAGEAGEACNAIKKLVREKMGLKGSRITMPELVEELADVIICADLVALTHGCRDRGFYSTVRLQHDPLLMGIQLDGLVGKVCQMFSTETVPERDPVEIALVDVRDVARAMISFFGYDPSMIVSAKFNETSRKVGFPVFLDLVMRTDRRAVEQVDLTPRKVGKAPELGMPYRGDESYMHRSRERDDQIDTMEEQRRRRRAEDERLLAEQGGNDFHRGVAAGVMLDQMSQPTDKELYVDSAPSRQQDPPQSYDVQVQAESPAPESSYHDSGSSSSDSGGGGGD